MDSFERSFEDMDVRSEYVEQTMNSSTTAAMPEGEVDTLTGVTINQVKHAVAEAVRLDRVQLRILLVHLRRRRTAAVVVPQPARRRRFRGFPRAPEASPT